MGSMAAPALAVAIASWFAPYLYAEYMFDLGSAHFCFQK
jgi:hypothetical protein